MKNVAILCSRIYYDKHKIDKTAKPFGSGGCSSRFVVSTVFLLHDCVYQLISASPSSQDITFETPGFPSALQ